jgi:light-regulated signal transduction histidine kinase (bacteriophytochrome)
MAGAESLSRLADLDSCAREPVHIIGHIQSHGMLFALSETDLIVRQVSVNVDVLLGETPDYFLGSSLEAALGAQQYNVFQTRLRADDLVPEKALRVVVGNRGLEMNCVAHRYDGVLIVEFELAEGEHAFPPSELAANMRVLLARMERASDTADYCRVAASEMHRLAGFDRVMVYRFDADWNGEIIAEAGTVAEPGEPAPISYLGMSFPASDIPAQARQLFLTNPVRAIADIDSTPVPIVPEIGPTTRRPLDMTLAFLRSPSPVHVEYLHNISIRSSLAVSIIVEKRLWGMIACHHHAPRGVDCSTRAVCDMIARNLALQVALRNADEAKQSRLSSAELLADYVETVERSNAPVDAESLRNARLLDLFDADGLIACLGGIVSSLGVTPAQESLLSVIAKLQTIALRGIASSNVLRALDQRAESFSSEASGALYIGLSKQTSDYLLFLRRELIATVVWAGNPDKAVNVDLAGKLHPRRSFAAWQETVRGCARPWSDADLENARSLRTQLLYLQSTEKLRTLE